MATYNFSDLNTRYEELTGLVRCDCTLAMELVGGQPADEPGVRVFVQHHLHLAGEDAESAVRRIMKEELGERDVAPQEGELAEKQVYGVNALRRSSLGPWLANHMVKACCKQAASRLDIFRQLRGTKGDFAETGRVSACGPSLVEPDHPERIYLLSSDGTAQPETYWREFMGRVSTPAGMKSIIHHSECVAPGSRFFWEMRFISKRVSENDVADTLAMMMVVGIGSARSLERGKFRIDHADITLTDKQPARKLAPVSKNNVPD